MAFQFLKDAHTTGKDETERAKLLVALVGTIVNTGDLRFNSQKQIRWLEVQRDMARFTKERMQEANALGNLGIAYRRLDDPNKAITIYEECLKIHREINDREGEGKTLGNLGNAFFQIGEAAKAIKFLEEALTLKRETKDHHGMASSLGSLGNAYVRLGNVGMAIKLHIECFKLYRELGDPRGESYALGNLGNDYFALNKLREAIEFYIQALMINRLLQDENGEASTLWAYALALLRMGDRAQAIIHAEEALKIYESIESSTFSQVRAALMNWRGHA
jgi:tetratricopeptide (TPR) repeat protein